MLAVKHVVGHLPLLPGGFPEPGIMRYSEYMSGSVFKNVEPNIANVSEGTIVAKCSVKAVVIVQWMEKMNGVVPRCLDTFGSCHKLVKNFEGVQLRAVESQVMVYDEKYWTVVL